MMNRFQAIFVLGGPGSGKGTQCSLISKKYKYKHLSAGQLLRNEQKDNLSPYKEIIQKIIDEGKIVPSHITISLLQNAMIKSQTQTSKFLIDGFPRNLQNLNSWHKTASESIQVPFILYLVCSEEQMLKRLIKRSETSNRSDDECQIIKKRFLTHKNDTSKVIQEYRRLGKVKQVNADGRSEDIFKAIELVFDEERKRNVL